MSEMVNRVAQAVADEMLRKYTILLDEHAHTLARAAIAAMRNPTEAMISTPMATCYNTGPYGSKEVRRIWQAMIDEALR